jgi:hypothetical protein
MPFKEKLKNFSANPRKKAQYKVINWTEYNKSLRKRRELSLYFPRDDLKSQFINGSAYIELIYMFYRLLGLGIRQITGYFEDLWCTKKLEIPVSRFDRFKRFVFCHTVESTSIL